MTEIPEHLLKRAAARRAAMTGGDAPADAPAADAPAAAGAPAPAAVEKAAGKKAPAPIPTLDDAEPPAKPDIAVVAAAKRRKRTPLAAAAVLSVLPLWAFLYYFAVKPPPAGSNDPIAIGKEVYSANCAGCHLADGAGIKGGGTGQELKDGHVLATFADPLTMAHWIAYGAHDGARANNTYGDKDRPGGAEQLLPLEMPPFGTSLTPEEIAAVTIYVRQEISGGNPKDDPNFNVDTFTADPDKMAELVQEVIDLKAGGDPDIASIDGAEKTSSKKASK